MNTKLISSIALSLAALSAGSAFAAQPATPVTRAQVLAELAEAQRTGDIMDTRTGKMLNELYPNLYPAKAAAPGKTHAPAGKAAHAPVPAAKAQKPAVAVIVAADAAQKAAPKPAEKGRRG